MASDSPHSLLKKALSNGRIDVLKSLLSELALRADFHQIINASSTDNGTLLHEACKSGETDAVRTLLSSGANPCCRNNQGLMPLQLAANPAIQQVFQHELLQAVAHSKCSRVCQLLSCGVPIDATDSPTTMSTPLHWAATYGSDDIVRVLLEGGAPINVQNAKGDTALHEAVRRGDSKIVQKLLEHGANPLIRNKSELDCYQLAVSKPEILQRLSAFGVQQIAKHSRTESLTSVESLASSVTNRISVKASSTNASMNGPSGNNHKRDAAQIAWFEQCPSDICWKKLIWPPPQKVFVREGERILEQGRLKLNLGLSARQAEKAREIMEIWTVFAPLLARVRISVDFSDFLQAPEQCGGTHLSVELLPNVLRKSESYVLDITEGSVFRICASDVTGLQRAVVTLVQIALAWSGRQISSDNGSADVAQANVISLPCIICRDWSDISYRGALIEMSNHRIFTPDTFNRILAALALVKMNLLLIHVTLETHASGNIAYKIVPALQPSDLTQILLSCKNFRMDVGLSLDFPNECTKSTQIDQCALLRTFHELLATLEKPRVLRFGSHLATWLAHNSQFLVMLQREVSQVWLSFSDLGEVAALPTLPSCCVVCLNCNHVRSGASLSELLEHYLAQPICFEFSTTLDGFMTKPPEDTFKAAMIAGKLMQKCQPLAVLVADWTTTEHITFPSLAYPAQYAVLGMAWNPSADMKVYGCLLGSLVAKYAFLEPSVTRLVQQVLTLGHIEQDMFKIKEAACKNDKLLMDNAKSVLLELLVAPDNVSLEKITPLMFKKTKVELSKCLQSVNALKSEIPYNFELALALSEAQLTVEMLLLATRLGMALSIAGTNPHPDAAGAEIVNVGVANLTLTTRTDLANKLLELRTNFQHVWLSRNAAGTLSFATQMFDRLLDFLLPGAAGVKTDTFTEEMSRLELHHSA